MSTQIADRAAVEVDAWDCACGRRIPAGISLCPTCGRPSPYGDFIQPLPQTPKRVRGVRLAFGVIGLNVVMQGVLFGMVQAGRIQSGRAIELALWAGLAFYCVVLAIIAGPLLTLRPHWLGGNPSTAPVFGIEVGLAAAAALIVVLWVGAGHPVIDPSARALVSEGSVPRTLLAFLVIAGAAPLVEELLFRGVVAQSLSRNGATVAVAVSSVLFALAHLRSLAYYTACGVVLGLLYWRRGLWASIAAHATFNGCLVVLAVVVVFGPTHVLSNGTVSVRAPAGWQLASADAPVPSESVLAIEGPSGATILVLHQRNDGRRPSLDDIVATINGGAVPLPPGTRIDGTAHVKSYPTGRGVEVGVNADGHDGVLVLIPKGASVWIIAVATEGSDRAEREYPEILESLDLPANP